MKNKENPNRELRRFKLLKRYGLFGDDTKGLKIVRATTALDLQKAYRLVHDIFVEKQYILPLKSKIRIRPWETSPDTATFIGKKEDNVLAVQSLILDSEDLKLPSDRIFGEELDALRKSGAKLSEASNEAVADSYRKSAVPTELMRTLLAQAWHSECKYIVTSISPSHRNFYEFLGFRQQGDIKSFSLDIEDPVALMCWDIEESLEKWADIAADEDSVEAFLKKYGYITNPYIPAIGLWAYQAKRLFSDTAQMRELFGNCYDLFDTATPDQIDAIRNRLGPVFEQVYSDSMEQMMA